MSDTVKLGYSSSKNINFRGEIDTRIERDQWDQMTPAEKDDVMEGIVWDLVDLYEIED
jgi:hypothetical protein